MARLGMALIGLGMVSDTIAEAIADLPEEIALCGVMGRSQTSGAAFLERHAARFGEDVQIYGDLSELLADARVEAVILATPPDAREEIVSALVAAGKPILMEKPLERTLAAAARIVGLCTPVRTGVIFQHRAKASARMLRERLPELGALYMAEISVPWWRPQSYYDEPGRGTYARDGGGVMLTQAIHVMDLALHFTGPVAEVNAMVSTTATHEMEGEDLVAAGLEFANGAVGHLFASTAAYPGRKEEIVLHCAHGSARLAGHLLELTWRDGRVEQFGTEGASGGGADPMAFSENLHRAVLSDFAAKLRSGAPFLADIGTAIAVHALIDGIERSGQMGRRVRVKSP